ncbi:hypothetical protein N7499_002587 [Penicillium canescens]|nr:hypothetical protein N7499_002587 [Penicillium canescens]
MQVATMQGAMAEPSPNQAPEGPDDMWTERLAREWKDMERRVQTLAELSRGTKYEENLQPGNVIQNLERVQAKSKQKANSTWGKIRESLNDTLTVIGKVGGMAADAASQVFGPAGQCYNAINFVISAWKGYIEAFEVLNGLLEDCAEFLNRLPSYSQGGMDANLCRVTSKTLGIFVDICGRALKLKTSRSSKIVMFAKIAFLDKGDFSDLRADMDKNTQREMLSGIAGAYKHSRIAAEGITATTAFFADSKAERLEKEQEQRDSQALMNALSFEKTPGTWNFVTQEPIETWKTINNKIHNRRVAGTGDWLLKDDLFKAWVKSGKEPLLAFVGEEGAGKSHLISAAISHLRTRGALPVSSKDGKSRRLVAFHYIDNAKPNARFYDLGKSIIWQFTASDASYKQSVAATCRNSYIEPKDVLHQLLLDNDEDLEKIDAVFFIVIHNLGDKRSIVDETFMKFLGELRSKSSAVRVLFSTTESTMEKLKMYGISCPTIVISEKNESDRRKYIAHRMDRMRVLSNTREQKVTDVRKMIQDSLCEKIKDSYHRINMDLDRLDPLETEEEIRESLHGAGRTLAQHVQDEIKNLNMTRTSKELAEINEIILWLDFAKERMSPEIMTAVLHVKNKGASLRPLQDRLKDKFRLFEINDDGFVDFRATDMSVRIQERRDVAQGQQKSIQAVSKNEVDIVNHFLRTVCPSDLLDKLELTKHFEKKLETGQEQICREDRLTGNFLIAKACVAVLAHDDPRLSVLREYAAAHLVHHMLETRRELISPDSLATFGFNLAKIFHDPKVIDNLLWVSTPYPALPPLLCNDKFLEEIYSWTKEPTVASKIDAERPTHWWKVDDSNDPKTLIEPSIRQMAVQCFLRESRAEVSVTAFNTIQVFCQQMGKCPDAVAELRQASSSEVEKWCQVALGKPLDTLWHTQMAMILRNHGAISDARERCHQALKLSPNNWRASLLLAKLVESRKEAIRVLEKLTKRFEENEKLREKYVEAFADIAYNLGHRYWDQNMFDEAIESYTKSIERDPSAYEHTFLIISRYSETEKWDKIWELLDKMSELDDAHLTLMVLAMSKNREFHTFHTILLRAMLETDKLEISILEMRYGNAIRIAKDQEDYTASFYLQHFYANALSALWPAPMTKVRDVLEDAVKDLTHTNLDLPRAFFLVGYRLGAIYLREAKKARADKGPDAAEKALKKLGDIVPEALMESQMRLPLSLFAARYHKINQDDESARASAHNTLRVAIELLSDKDSSNDLLAYQKILYAAIPFQDERNVNAALAMMKLETPFMMTCSCGCGHTWDTPENMWFCMDCIRVVLRSCCKDRIKDKKLPNSVCHESHIHFEVGPWNAEKMSQVKEGHVPYKGTVITMEEWRKKIIAKYELGKSIMDKYEAGKSGVRNALRH